MVEVRRRIQRIGPPGSRPDFEPEIFRSRYLQLTRSTSSPPTVSKPSVESVRAVPTSRQHGGCCNTSKESTSLRTPAKPNQALAAFIEVWRETGIDEFDKLVEILLELGEEIFNFHAANRVTNGRISPSNNTLGVLKRVAYGFVNVTHFAARALLLTPAWQHERAE